MGTLCTQKGNPVRCKNAKKPPLLYILFNQAGKVITFPVFPCNLGCEARFTPDNRVDHTVELEFDQSSSAFVLPGHPKSAYAEPGSTTLVQGLAMLFIGEWLNLVKSSTE